MRLQIVGCHAEGEVGDVIVGGVAAPPGETLWEQRSFIARDQTLRNFVLNEPRGGLFRHVNLLVPAIDPTADIGFIIMEPADTPPMSGSNSMCVANVVLETGIVPMTEPVTELRLEAPAGVVAVRADCADGKVRRISVENVPSFAHQRDVMLDVAGLGELRVDTAFGGDSFVLVDASDLGVSIVPEAGRALVDIGMRVVDAANEQLGFEHPENDWDHISFCQIAGPLTEGVNGFEMTSTSVIQPGKLDRSPTGTGVSARLGLLHDQGRARTGDRLLMRSVIGSEFGGEIVRETTVGSGSSERAAVVPRISGRAWITGRYEHELDPTDPWPAGYRVGDTWPSS